MSTRLSVNTNTGFGIRRGSNTPQYVDQSGLPPSPVSPTSPGSLLNPPNPAFSDFAPAGGILLNKRRPSDVGEVDFDDEDATGTDGNPFVSTIVTTIPETEVVTGNTAILPMSPPLSNNGRLDESNPPCRTSSLTSRAASESGGNRPSMHGRTSSAAKIRFAPLPTPNRERSLSFGEEDIYSQEYSSESPFGRSDRPWQSGLEQGEVDSDEDENDRPRRNSTSWKTMGMGRKKTGSFGASSYMYTKKLLKPFGTSSENNNDAGEYASLTSFGAPLKKSISTGGLMGNSPFRSSHEQDRKRNFLGQTVKEKEPRRNSRIGSTADAPDFSSLSSSLGYKADTSFAPSSVDNRDNRRPVKMLNGRVYGGKKGAGSTKAREPDFVEWGGMMGSQTGGLGSNATIAPVTKSVGSNAEEEDDGSGMGWVKKRKEQRERERRASENAPPIMEKEEDQHIVGSVPALKVTPPHWPATGEVSPGAAQSDHHPFETPMAIKVGAPWEEGRRGEGDPDVSSDDQGDFTDDDAGDFSDDDDDDDLDLDDIDTKNRSTSSAAGVELMLRHKD